MSSSPAKIQEERDRSILERGGIGMDRFAAKNVMRPAGDSLWKLLEQKLPKTKRVLGKLIDGKVYSAVISADTEINNGVIEKIASKLADQLKVDEAFAFVPLSMKHHVEKEELCANGIVRMVHYFDVTTSRMLVAFEVAAGRDPEVDVEIKVTPL